MGGAVAPSRRELLRIAAAGVAAVTVGCTRGPEQRPASPASPTKPAPPTSTDHDDQLLSEAAERERELLDLHAATLRRHPGLADRLRALTEHHGAHLSALDGLAPRRSRRTPRVATRPDAALRNIATAERQAAQAGIAACARTGSADLARLLASVAGCEAAHGFLLGEER